MMRCKMPTNKGRSSCNQEMYLHMEGAGKYDVWHCEVHGLVSVLKGRKRE